MDELIGRFEAASRFSRNQTFASRSLLAHAGRFSAVKPSVHWTEQQTVNPTVVTISVSTVQDHVFHRILNSSQLHLARHSFLRHAC